MPLPARTVRDSAQPVGRFARLVRCDNPGLMELEGTNTWLLQAPGSPSCVVVDPGPDGHPGHLDAVAAGLDVELVLVTHGHLDHVGGLDDFFEMTGAPTRAFGVEHCRDASPLVDGEELEAAGLSFRVLHTPGHTRDSVAFVVSDERERAVLTGDTVLGRGSTLLNDDTEALGAFLGSLDRLAGIPSARMLPGHGPAHEDLAPVVDEYRRHRHERLDAIRRHLEQSGLRPSEADPGVIVDELYTDTPDDLRFAAVLTVRAQLAYLGR